MIIVPENVSLVTPHVQPIVAGINVHDLHKNEEFFVPNDVSLNATVAQKNVTLNALQNLELPI